MSYGEGHHHHHHHEGQGGGYPQYPQPGGYGGGYGGGYQRREFYIVSEMNQKVLDIQGARAEKDTGICTYKRNVPPTRNQLWYMNEQGHIHSALNDMAFSNHSNGNHLKTTNETGNPRAQWRAEGNKIVNGLGEALDIRGKSNHDGAEVISYKYEGHVNQHWIIQYV